MGFAGSHFVLLFLLPTAMKAVTSSTVTPTVTENQQYNYTGKQEDSSTPARQETTLFTGPFGTGTECVAILKKYRPDIPIIDYLCICFNRQCLSPDAPNATESPYGTGGECVDKITKENPDMKQYQYMCVCHRVCFESEEALRKFHARNGTAAIREGQGSHLHVKGAMYIVIFAVGLLGNLLVIVTVSGFMGKMTVTNIYILNLAVADLLVILVCVPLKAYETYYSVWEFAVAGCKIVGWLYFACFMGSVFTLMCMALERYMVINHPMRSQMMSSRKRTLIILVGIWISAICLSMPAFFLSKLDIISIQCLIDEHKRLPFYLYVFVAIFLIPTVLMTFAYTKTSYTLWVSIKNQRQMKSTAVPGDSKVDKANDTSGRGQVYRSPFSVPVIRVLIGVLVVFIVCWAPYLATQIYMQVDHGHFRDTDFKQQMLDVVVWFNFLSLANSSLNPILYGALSRQFRMGFLRCLTCKRRGVEAPKSYYTATTSGGAMTSSRAQPMTTIKDSRKPDYNSNGVVKKEANGTVQGNNVGESEANGKFQGNNVAEIEANGKVQGNTVGQNEAKDQSGSIIRDVNGKQEPQGYPKQEMARPEDVTVKTDQV